MGGCRCTFRSCTNNTANSPAMHFFHFPVRDPKRLQQWMKNSNNLDFVSLQDSQLKNRVVCQEHFRDDCFMNYLHDKLTQRAVPSLLKLDTGEILDFESESEPDESKTEEPPKHTVLLLNKSTSFKQKEVFILNDV